ncbi:MAG: DIP1984 family protein [Bacteroidota bacterium]
MKLAEALLLRADLKRRVESLSQRLQQNIVVQEGMEPAMDPSELLAQLDSTYSEYQKLVGRINETNQQVKLESGDSLMEGLVKRETLTDKRQKLMLFVSTGSNLTRRYNSTDILNVVTIDIAGLNREVDDLSKQIREVDTAIQQANWLHDLI